jgi:hypothetical protein
MTISVFSKDWTLMGQYVTIAEVLGEYGGLELQINNALTNHTFYQGMRIWFTSDVPKHVAKLMKDREEEIIETLSLDADNSDDELLNALTQIDILKVTLEDNQSEIKGLRTKLKVTEDELKSEKNEKTKLEKTNRLLKNDLELTKVQLNKYKNELEDLIKTNKEYEDVLKDIYKVLGGNNLKVHEELEDVILPDYSNAPKYEDVKEEVIVVEEEPKVEVKPLTLKKTVPVRNINFNWEASVKDKSFPLRDDLKKSNQWHFRQLTKVLGLSENTLATIFKNVLLPMDYTRDYTNENILSAAEVVLVAFSVYSIKEKTNKASKVLEQVKLLYPGWLDVKEDIQEWLK